MLSRRQFLKHTLKGSSLIAFGSVVPSFVAGAAQAAPVGKDRIAVVLELTGGNDGLNTVIPYGDDLYHKARPTLRYKKEQIIRLDGLNTVMPYGRSPTQPKRKDQVIHIDGQLGLNPGLRALEPLLETGQLAIVQGVGYPNPNRSHFESMDVWQSADPRRKLASGWLGRSLGAVKVRQGEIVGIHVGTDQMPLAMQGSATGTPTIDPAKPYELVLDGKAYNARDLELRGLDTPVPEGPKGDGKSPAPDPKVQKAAEQHRAERMKLIKDLSGHGVDSKNDMLRFVQRSALQTYTAVDRLRKLMSVTEPVSGAEDDTMPSRFSRSEKANALAAKLSLVARIIRAGFGTRIFYVALDGFDTHADQRRDHEQLLGQLGAAVAGFFKQLQESGNAERVVLMTFSEFGRRVQENGSKGTDHGAGSCLFVAGPKVKGGLVGKQPSLARENLDAGDMKHQIDFRQVYATLLDQWLECDSRTVLGGRFEHVSLFK
jgi:uncharacterized protein (DUF1501 family)